MTAIFALSPLSSRLSVSLFGLASRSRFPVTLLVFALAACQTAPKVSKPLFTGDASISDVRDEAASGAGLGAPTPAFRRLKFTIRTAAKGKLIGESTETLKAASKGYGQSLEEITYSLAGGKCTVYNRTTAVAVGGFLSYVEAAETWSSNCSEFGGGRDRRQVVTMTVKSGQLFPLKVGNKLSLEYTVLGSGSERDTGRAQYEETAEETYEVAERIADFRLADGRSLGEAFLVRVTAVKGKARKKRSYEFVFSTRLGWRVAYSTDIRYTLVDWSQ